jgi:uncharacterized protein (DUF1697 family)
MATMGYVGGNNIIKMAALKSCFEKLGFTEITTYIQSGNVIFSSSENDVESLCEKIEQTLSKVFGYNACVLLVKHRDLKRVVESASKGFGTEPTMYRYDVLFLKNPLKAKEVIKIIPHKEGVDEVSLGTGVLYFSRLESKATQSHLNKLVSMSIYRQMTIRNWNTTRKLFSLMENSP